MSAEVAEKGKSRRFASRALVLGLALAGAGGAENHEAGVAQEADLAVTLVDPVDPIAAGGIQIYEIAVANRGPGRATGVALQHELPPGGLFLGAEPASIGCRLTAARLVECGLGAIAAGDAIDLRIGALIDPRVEGEASSEALAAGAEPDPVGANDGAEAVTDVVPARAMVGARRAGGRALAAVVKEGRSTVSLVLTDPEGGGRESSVELPGFRAAALAEAPSPGPGASSAIASLAAGFGGETRVAVVDAGSRRLLGDHEVPGDWWALDIVAVDSFAGTPAAELALLLRERESGELRVRVLDAASGLAVRDHPLAGSPVGIGMALLPSFDGTPRPELAIVTRSPGAGDTRVLVVDADSGVVLRAHDRGPGLFPLGIVALSDLGLAGGTSAAEVGVLMRTAATGDLHVQVIDASNGASFGPIDLDDELLPGHLVALPGVGSGPAPAVAVLGRVDPHTLVLSVQDAATGATVTSIVAATAPRAPLPLGLAAIPGDGGTAGALAVLLEVPGEPARVAVFEAPSGAPLAEFVLP